MKKVIISILVLCLVLTLSACNNANSSNKTTSQTNQGDSQQDHRGFGTESYTEYQDYLEEFELPSNFTTYEMIRPLGSFKSFTCSIYGDFNYYSYSVTDEAGYDIGFSIRNDLNNPSSSNTITNVDPDDMRFLNSNEQGTFYGPSGLEYNYIQGELYDISFLQGNLRYSIYFDMYGETHCLANYPINNSSLVSQLLNTQTADDALEILSSTLPK